MSYITISVVVNINGNEQEQPMNVLYFIINLNNKHHTVSVYSTVHRLQSTDSTQHKLSS